MSIKNRITDFFAPEVDDEEEYLEVNEEEAKQYTTDVFQSLKLLDPLTEDRNTFLPDIFLKLIFLSHFFISINSPQSSV